MKKKGIELSFSLQRFYDEYIFPFSPVEEVKDRLDIFNLFTPVLKGFIRLLVLRFHKPKCKLSTS